MKCPECNSTMEFIIFDSMATRWVCDNCGRVIQDGTTELKIGTSTASNYQETNQ